MKQPTYADLEQAIAEQSKVIAEQSKVIAEQSKIIAEQSKTIAELKTKIAALEARLGKNSGNSSKPPSSDQKGSNPNKEEAGRRGAAHSGISRKLLPESMVTSRERRTIKKCPRCQSDMAPTGESAKWQQVDIPPIQPLVHEIELCTCQCTRCGLKKTPELAHHETFLMGPNLEGLTNLLMSRFRQSHLMVRSFISMLIPGLKLSQGLISKVKKRGAEAFASATDALLQSLLKSSGAKYMDATGWRHAIQNWQAIILRSPSIIRYFFRDNQNGTTIQNILPFPTDHLVVDRGLATQKINVQHLQYCLAHLLRNIQGMAEDPRISNEETQMLGEIHETLQGLFHDRHRYDLGAISIETWRQCSYKKWAWMRETFEGLGNLASTPSLKRFCRRILKDWKHFMVYLSRNGPMTNNLAEEGLRNLVIARKLCFGSRSSYGLNWREAIHSCVESLQRQGKSMLDFFSETIRAHRLGQDCPTII